jgi:hypothetical protein
LSDRADLSDSSEIRMRMLDHIAVVDEIWMLESLAARFPDLRGDTTVGPEDFHPLVGIAFEHAFEDSASNSFQTLGGQGLKPGRNFFIRHEFAQQIDGLEKTQEEMFE